MAIINLPKASVEFYKENQDQIFESGELAEGSWNRMIADWACCYTKARQALAVNSNGAGLFILLSLLKEYRGKKKVFIQSNTMYGVRTIAITSGLELCGYVDCSLDFLMPTYEQVVDFISVMDKPEESVFLLTHIGGWLNPDIKKIAEFCRHNGVSLIEDCAHSLGSTLAGNHSGLFGDGGVYSLYATKAIPVGEGGIVVTNDEELGELAKKFVIYDRFDQEMDIGINLRMSEIAALLAYSVVKETESILANKYTIAEQYVAACKHFSREFIDPRAQNQRSNLYKFILLSRGQDPIAEFDQIKTRTSPVYGYALGRDRYECATRHICLPIWYDLSEEVISQVVTELIR